MLREEIIIFREEKKHSVRYDPLPNTTEPISRGIYITKNILPVPYPRALKITIEHVEDKA